MLVPAERFRKHVSDHLRGAAVQYVRDPTSNEVADMVKSDLNMLLLGGARLVRCDVRGRQVIVVDSHWQVDVDTKRLPE